ncbi:hypothetical protein PM082_024770 [Marasmius tenuissimus]|nr:hypothetical protein PM082_024770 [Marasmius tenuissimus]
MALLKDRLEPWFATEVMIIQPIASLTASISNVTWFVHGTLLHLYSTHFTHRSVTFLNPGFYIALFFAALKNLCKYRRENQALYITWTALLFLLCTLDNIVETWYRVRQAIKIYTEEHTKEYALLQMYARHDLVKTVQR